MTHLWKTSETYIFDMPEVRIMDVYGKSVRHPLKPYLMKLNPKVTNVRFCEDGHATLIDIGIPKYPDEHPYFTSDDSHALLVSYMDYANMSYEEIHAWYKDPDAYKKSKEDDNDVS